MFKTPLNLRTVTLKLKRKDVVDLLIACNSLMEIGYSSPKWSELHEKLRLILADFDANEV